MHKPVRPTAGKRFRRQLDLELEFFMTRRRKRELDQQERLLWEAVTRAVMPLNGRNRTPSPAPMPTSGAANPATGKLSETVIKPTVIKPEKRKAARALSGQPESADRAAPMLPPMVSMLRKQRRAVVRGAAPIDAKLDLHGLRQDEAHHRLRSFLLRAAQSGHRTVLVVTGKGARLSDNAPVWAGAHGERGVLRRIAPFILESPELRDIVLGYELADQRHGGVGALYVRLRRKSG